MNKFLGFVGSIILFLGAFFAAPLLVDKPVDIAVPKALGAYYDIPTVVALFETTLAASITESATTMTLTRATDKDGNTLASSTYAFIIDEGTASEEFVIADCTNTSCANLERGISVLTGTSSVTALKKAHRRGASVKITNAPQLIIVSNMLRGIQGIPSVIKYLSIPTTTIDDDENTLASVGYVNSIAFTTGGQVNASETAKGFSELATQNEMAAGSSTGSTGGALVVQSRYSSSTRSASTIYNVVTLATGFISETFFPTTFTNNNTYTGTSTFSNQVIGGPRAYYLASSTFTGATTPQPASLSKGYSTTTATGTLALADADDPNLIKFYGFVVSNGSNGATVTIQTTGIVPGFTGLTKGATYWLQNTAGTIGTTPGAYAIKVGEAISTTEVLIQRGARFQHSTGSFADAGNIGQQQNTTVFLGFKPTKIRMTAHYSDQDAQSSIGSWINGTYSTLITAVDESAGTVSMSSTQSYIGQLFNAGGTEHWQLLIQDVNENGFVINANQRENSPAAVTYLWEAEGEI